MENSSSSPVYGPERPPRILKSKAAKEDPVPNCYEITHIVTDGDNDSKIWFKNRTFVIRKGSLGFFMKQLPHEWFFRLSNSCIFHIMEVKYYKYCNRCIVVEFSSGEIGWVSERKVNEFLALREIFTHIEWNG